MQEEKIYIGNKRILTEDEVNQLVDEKVQEILKTENKPKTYSGWIRLRNEISDWCHKNADKQNNRSYQTLKDLIYSTLKFVTGVSRIDEIDESNIEVASITWAFLKAHNPIQKEDLFEFSRDEPKGF